MRLAYLAPLLLLVTLQLSQAIRVYTGTALSQPRQIQQTPDDSKISKRSWSQPETQPGLYKVKLTQRGYIQFLRYLVDIPPLQQYTFCIWVTSNNNTFNHPLFSYSKDEKESFVKVWLSPRDKSLKITIKNEPIARIPVTFREGRWYHVCQSWSGVTGEWVLFIDGKVKASDRVQKHIGTMLPGGGDIAVGQELTDFNRGLDDGVEGEIFGFNLVDEAVDLQETVTQAFTHYRPEIDAKSFVPQFRKLPVVRKSFDEIQDYIAQLPATDDETTAAPLRPGELPASSQPGAAPVRRIKPRVRSQGPGRKVVVYREGRIDDVNKSDEPIELLRTQRLLQRIEKPTTEDVNSIPDLPRPKINQAFDVNYNMHTYRGIKNEPKVTEYKIYEEESDDSYGSLEDVGSNQKDSSGKRRARQNFDVYSLWEANRVNPFSIIPYQPVRNKYHFEIEQQASRRSLALDPSEEIQEASAAEPRTRKTLPDVIPVHEEIDEGFRRRRRRNADPVDDGKRDARHITADPEFRRLPSLPDGFVNLFNPETNKAVLIQKISSYLASNNNSSDISPPTVAFFGNEALQRRDPQNFPSLDQLLQEETQVTEASQSLLDDRIAAQQLPQGHPNMKSAGSDLVERSYNQCAMSRGTPITDTRHILISWADTPVRIYGGAMVSNANNVCGHF